VQQRDKFEIFLVFADCASYNGDLVSYKNQINRYIAVKSMHILVHVLPKTRFIDVHYFVNTLLTLARLKTLTAFFSKQ